MIDMARSCAQFLFCCIPNWVTKPNSEEMQAAASVRNPRRELHGFYSATESKLRASQNKLEGSLWDVYELHGQKGKKEQYFFFSHLSL